MITKIGITDNSNMVYNIKVSEERKNKIKNSKSLNIIIKILCLDFCWHKSEIQVKAQKKDIKDKINNKNLIFVTWSPDK